MTVQMIPPVCSPSATFTEEQIFNEIREMETKDLVYCFHSVGLEKHQTKEHAECDFVLLTPRGVFCIEVKGGAVKRKDGVWTIGSGTKSYSTTEGPFKQAEGCRWAIMKHLQDRGVLKRNEALFGWGVAFPSVVFECNDAEWSADVVYDLRDLKKPFSAYLSRLTAYFEAKQTIKGPNPNQPLSGARLRACADVIRPDFETGLTVLGLVVESQRAAPKLSREQFGVLDLVLSQQNPRLICEGGPGTGKTILAMEAARRLSLEEKRVLYLCFNTELAVQLNSKKEGAKYKVSTLHKFMNETIIRAGLSPEQHEGISESKFFSDILPELFEEACEILLDSDQMPQFDALVVDEAQDILSEKNLACMMLVLSGGLNGRWAFFLDRGDQANVYSRFEASALELLTSSNSVVVNLKLNYRNPPKTAAEAYFFSKFDPPECRSKLNSPVKFLGISNEKEAASKLRALLVELIRDGVSPGDIAILSWRRAGERLADRYPPNVGKDLVAPRDQKSDKQQIISSSIASFKGLEAEIVIVTDVPELLDDDWQTSLLVVALTRTRTKCYALVPNDFIQWRSKSMLEASKSPEERK